MSLRFLPVVLLLAPAAAAQDNFVMIRQKISATQGGFAGPLANFDYFGSAVCSIGDLDQDGVEDIAVGAPGTAGGGSSRGAVWILFLKTVGNPVKSAVKIDDTIGGFFAGGIQDFSNFGSSLSLIGDLSGDGFPELAVGAPGNWAVSPPTLGKVYLLSLNGAGGVAGVSILAGGVGGFPANLVEASDPFGQSVAGIGDIDANGVPDLAIGRKIKTQSGYGYLFVVRLEANGTTQHVWRIGKDEGGFTFDPNSYGVGSWFGSALSALGDLNRDGVPDLLVGEAVYDGPFPGQYWILSLAPQGTVVHTIQIAGYDPLLGGCCGVAKGLARLGDVDGDGVSDLFLGAAGRGYYPDPDHPVPTTFRPQAGGSMVLLMNTDGTPKGSTQIDSLHGNLGIALDRNDHFGTSVCALGDLDGEGVFDAAAGAPHDDDGGNDRGAVYLLQLNGYAFPSSATVYNGSHSNALCHGSSSVPALGTTWSATVDTTNHPGAGVSCLIVSRARRDPGTFILGGDELLLQTGAQLVGASLKASSGAIDTFDSPIPASPSLFGLELVTQALILGGGDRELCNALELVLQN